MTAEKQSSIELANEESASSILYQVLNHALETYADDISIENWPANARQFRQSYVSVLPEFEAARLASERRFDIARLLASEAQKRLVWKAADSEAVLPLDEYLQQPASALELQKVVGRAKSGWLPSFDWPDHSGLSKTYLDFGELGKVLERGNIITLPAAESLNSVTSVLDEDGELRLSNRKIVVLGAAAEMAPTLSYLQTGANVLWIDRAPPSEQLLQGEGFSGTLTYPSQNADLLNQPAEILATIKAFASGDPVDLCLYAYAPGQARELRLTGAMNALVNALPYELVASVTILVSPTTPTQLQTSDVKALETRHKLRPGWEAALETLGLMGHLGGMAKAKDQCVIRSVVSIQGASYQAAQYLCKVMMAETWATTGQLDSVTLQPLRVSANTAAITQTKSLDHPVFDAAFGGAAALQVETFTPQQSKTMNALLAIVDWHAEQLPMPGKVRVHGGIHTLPYPLESALKPAAAIGFIKSPGLLFGLFASVFKGLYSKPPSSTETKS